MKTCLDPFHALRISTAAKLRTVLNRKILYSKRSRIRVVTVDIGKIKNLDGFQVHRLITIS